VGRWKKGAKLRRTLSNLSPAIIKCTSEGRRLIFSRIFAAFMVMYPSEGGGKIAMATQTNVNPFTYTRSIMGAWNTGESSFNWTVYVLTDCPVSTA